jgi:hypothetical protein
MLAFTVRDFITRTPLSDPSKVEWLVAIIEGNGVSERITQRIGVHKCTNEDYKKFYKTERKSVNLVKALKDTNGLFCINPLDVNGNSYNLKLWGRDESSP